MEAAPQAFFVAMETLDGTFIVKRKTEGEWIIALLGDSFATKAALKTDWAKLV